MELLFHSFSQQSASESTRESGLKIRPEGVYTSLGREIDFAVGLRFRKNLRASAVAGRFFPGRAFKEGSPEASYTEFKLSWTY